MLTQDCTVVFAEGDTQCFAAPNYLLLDVMTPGLYMREAAVQIQLLIAQHCGIVALVLNLAIFPLSDHQLYVAVHSAINTVVYTIIGLPIATIRRCEYVQQMQFGDTAKAIACTPDVQPVAELLNNALLAFGDVITNWMNIVVMMAQQKITGKAVTCDMMQL